MSCRTGASASRNTPGPSGSRGRQPVRTDERADRGGEERVGRGRPPHGEDEAPTRAQHTAGFRDRGLRIDHQHVRVATHHAVDRVRIEVDLLRVDDPELDVAYPEFARAVACRFEHRRREVARDQSPASTDVRGDLETRVAVARRKLQDRLSGARCELAHQPGTHRRGEALDVRTAPRPRRRDRLRDLVIPLLQLVGSCGSHRLLLPYFRATSPEVPRCWIRGGRMQ